MSGSLTSIAFVGFGEAAIAFLEGMGDARPGLVRAYDRKTEDKTTRAAKRADFAAAGVEGAQSAAEAVAGASLILSVVTADQTFAAACAAAPGLARRALYCDMNSVAPQTKRAAAGIVEGAGARYVDVAVMSPVRPALTRAPLFVAGPHRAEALAALASLTFQPTPVDGPVGAAAAIKMIRSVMVKGIEALTAECFLAAAAAGVVDAVASSLNASSPQACWNVRADYNLDRMLAHGVRRAAEMEEVALTLDALGVDSAMTRATIARQRAIGELGLHPCVGLPAKLDQIRRAP